MTTGYKNTELFRTVRLKWAEPTVTGAKRKGKAQKLLAQDIALGYNSSQQVAPKGKSLKNQAIIKSFAPGMDQIHPYWEG